MDRASKFVDQLLNTHQPIDLSFNRMYVSAENKSYIRCLAYHDMKCDYKFSNTTSRENLISIFNHLFDKHDKIYPTITNDFHNWCNAQRRLPSSASSTNELKTIKDVEDFIDSNIKSTSTKTSSVTKKVNVDAIKIVFYEHINDLFNKMQNEIAQYKDGTSAIQLKDKLKEYAMDYIKKLSDIQF